MLYAIVRDHLETFFAHARETYEAPLPRYVEQELRGYLRCGVFAHGFVRGADVLSALGRVFIEAVFARYRSWAKKEGLGEAPTGAVTHVQRFGSSVNLNVHFHSMLLDGVFTRDEQGSLRFHPAPSPTREELDGVVRRVHRRVLAWLAKSKLLDVSSVGDTSPEPSTQTSLAACAAIAMQRGAARALRDDPESLNDGGGVDAPPRAGEGAVERDGFNLHAGVSIPGHDDLGRERLMRYGARPPLALDRLRRLPDGRIAYRIKKLRDGRAKHRVMAPVDVRVPFRSGDTGVDARAAGAWQLLTPNVLSVKHWDRLLGGTLYAASPRVDWASLLRRSFQVDVLACPRCDGRLRVLGEVTDPARIRLVLDALGMPTDAPRAARARDPTELLGEYLDA